MPEIQQHGALTPVDHPSGTRGNHTVEAFPEVTDEAARNALAQVALDRGRHIFQSGGVQPGWYIARGTTGQWQYVGDATAASVADAAAAAATAQSAAATAQSAAGAAQSTANGATSAASAAQAAANAAQADADAAADAAAAAQGTANTALADAATAQSAATAAQGTANTAVSAAAAAQSTANTAVANAATAQVTANTAVTNAAAAQADVDAATAQIAALAASEVANDSSVVGATVKDALDTLASGPTIWMPNAAPLIPSAYDDEYVGAVIDPKWTLFDPSGTLTASIDTAKQMLRYQATGNAAVQLAGHLQPVPDSEFVIATRVFPIFAAPASGIIVGLAVWDSTAISAPATADLRTFDFGWSSAASTIPGVVSSRSWTAYNSGASASATVGTRISYLRMRLNGTLCTADFSQNGIDWQILSVITLGFVPAFMGTVFTAVQAGVVGVGRFEFFRVLGVGAGSSDQDATSLGRLVSVL